MAEVTSNTPGAVWNKNTYKWEKKKGGMLGPTGSTGSFNYGQDTVPDYNAMKGMIDFQLTDALRNRQMDPPKTRSGLFGVDWGGLFGGGGDDEKEKGGGTNWNKWATFGKGLMDWQTSREQTELGRMQNRTARDLLDFKKSSYLGDVARQDKVYAQNQQTADQKKFYLGKWLEAQGRGAEKPQYFDKDFELGNVGVG